MHGTAMLNAFTTLLAGGTVVTLQQRSFDIEELLDAIERYRVGGIAIVGDAFARPMLAALDAEPARWDISSLRVVGSGGVMWSSETKSGLLRHNPRLILVDTLGASEAIGVGSSITTSSTAAADTGRFTLSSSARVITEDGRDVVPGSGERGLLALEGRMPVGYLGDAPATARTFSTVDGKRYVIPGDWAEVSADGSVLLLGRGAMCINTGGEKVFPEEVEEALKTVPGVVDVAVVGTPDDRFGEVVTAVVVLVDGAEVDDEKLVGAVQDRLAAYKAPRRVVRAAQVARSAAGKVDYDAVRHEACVRLGIAMAEPA
jgi:acyl-coenzyme A synthetase/AMP-(fatty) acid ligase